MAHRLLNHDVPVLAWDREPAHVQPLAERGAEVAGTAAEVVSGAQAVITMLPTADVEMAVVERLLNDWPEETPWLQMSSVGGGRGRPAGRVASDHQVTLFDAPVSGSTHPAEEGQLTILASGPDSARGQVEPIFSALGSKVQWVGHAGMASQHKLAANHWMIAMVAALAETMHLCQLMGLEQRQFGTLLDGGPLGSSCQRAPLMDDRALRDGGPPGLGPPCSAAILLGMAKRTQTAFGCDTGLQVRMVAVMLLLGLVYAGFVAVLIAAGAGMLVTALVVAGLALAPLFLSDKLALRAVRARIVAPSDAPQVHATVERLCIQADLPKPSLAVAPTAVPNAFAMGRSPRSAVICVTSGILETLPPTELEAVLAHERAHIRNRDVLIMTVASFFASLAAAITQFGLFFGGDHRGRDDDRPGLLVLLLVSGAVYAISFFSMLAISRYREFAADRGAALTTGRPSALASALVRISNQMRLVPEQDLRAASQLNAFFVVPTRVRSTLETLLSTHPPVRERVRRLNRTEAELQGAGPAMPVAA